MVAFRLGPPPAVQPAPPGDALTQGGGALWDLFYKNILSPRKLAQPLWRTVRWASTLSLSRV